MPFSVPWTRYSLALGLQYSTVDHQQKLRKKEFKIKGCVSELINFRRTAVITYCLIGYSAVGNNKTESYKIQTFSRLNVSEGTHCPWNGPQCWNMPRQKKPAPQRLTEAQIEAQRWEMGQDQNVENEEDQVEAPPAEILINDSSSESEYEEVPVPRKVSKKSSNAVKSVR